MNEKVQDWLKVVISEIVSNPDGVEITNITDEMGVLFTLKVDKEDIGKVIGREGNTAKSIRSILRAVGMKYKMRANLKIDDGGNKPPHRDY